MLEPLGRAGAWVGLNFVTALDGAIAIDGRSGALGGPGDRAMFAALRDVADAVVVGAGTARAEDYGPTSLRAADARRARGQAPRPAVVLVTRSGDLTGLERLWADGDMRVVVATGPAADADALAAVRDRGATVLRTDGPDGGPDLTAMLARLRDEGWTRLLCEGGPSLAVDLLAVGEVTDLFTTVAPVVVGGTQTMLGERLEDAVRLELRAVRAHEGELFLHHSLMRS